MAVAPSADWGSKLAQGVSGAHYAGGTLAMTCLINSALLMLLLAGPVQGGLLTNGGFEFGLAAWRPLWTREEGAGTLKLDDSAARTGSLGARLEHQGQKDWSLQPVLRLPVRAGDVVEMEAWFKVLSGKPDVSLCAALVDERGKVLNWSFGARHVSPSCEWQRVRSRFAVPPGCSEIQPRIIGQGPIVVCVDDFNVERLDSITQKRGHALPASVGLTNPVLEVSLRTADATLAVRDRRTGQEFSQQLAGQAVALVDVGVETGTLQAKFVCLASAEELRGAIRLVGDLPEVTVELTGTGELPAPLRFPEPFVTRAGEYLVVPMNEGISYPVDDASIEPFSLVAYGGHGICMAFWGVTDGERGHAAIIETPDDASIRIERQAGRLVIAPQWDPQRGRFGYARRLRYVFFDKGGHVAIAKRYRAYAQQAGFFKTLAEKRAENPNVDQLIGAVNVWCWDKDAVPLVREMQASGIDRILWSNRQSPENLRALNDLGVLTSRYDIYQDVMDPSNFSRLRWQHPDWTTQAWPGDIILRPNGQFLEGWGVEAKDGTLIPCGVICDSRAVPYARERITAELATHPYRCRFIDTTTAAPWQECYATNHPMSRTESRIWKMRLLEYVSRDSRLVTGCETGHDAAVPFLHYFEGMLSLGPYRVPDAGRNMARIWTNAPEALVKFQLGHQYRLPLWELVFHDCVVAQWYWGDYNNKLPMLWDKRDAFNALYGTPPMFMFDRKLWEQSKDRFVRSYRATGPVARRVGCSEMTDHRFLTPDRAVQQTAFANGTTVTVNFDTVRRQLPNGTLLEPMEIRVR